MYLCDSFNYSVSSQGSKDRIIDECPRTDNRRKRSWTGVGYYPCFCLLGQRKTGNPQSEYPVPGKRFKLWTYHIRSGSGDHLVATFDKVTIAFSDENNFRIILSYEVK